MKTILTVSYNSKKELEKLYKSLQENPPSPNRADWEWIIVDNNSNEETKTYLEELDEEKGVNVLFLAENVGFGKANNLGADAAKGDVLYLLNPDTQVTQSTWNLEKNLEKNRKILAVPQIMTPKGEILQSCRAFPSILGLIKRRITRKKQQNVTNGPFWAQGSAWCLFKSDFLTLEGFDARYFLFFEDTDFCKRLWAAGGQILFDTNAVIHHKKERLSGQGFPLHKKVFWLHFRSAITYFLGI